MKPIKQQLKRLAYHATARLGPHRWPVRSPRLWILTYHRILPADDPRSCLEEPGMVVTPETFRRHLQWLQPEFELVSLGDWVERQRLGRPLPRKACAITFDDGWRDNYEFAFPILKEFGAPATIFVVSDMIGTTGIFWPNRLARLFSHLDSQGHLGLDAAWMQALELHTTNQPFSRDALALAISRCKSRSDQQIVALLDEAERSVGLEGQPERSLLDWDELQTMLASGLIDVGSHTCSHRRLGVETPMQDVVREVQESQTLLEQMIKRPVSLFCYPNGDTSDLSRNLVRKTYIAAVTTKRGINHPMCDLHTLSRVGLHNDKSNTRVQFLASLSTIL